MGRMDLREVRCLRYLVLWITNGLTLALGQDNLRNRKIHVAHSHVNLCAPHRKHPVDLKGSRVDQLDSLERWNASNEKIWLTVLR